MILSGNNQDTATRNAQTFGATTAGGNNFITGGQITIGAGRLILESAVSGPSTSTGNLPAEITKVIVTQGTSFVLDNTRGVNSNRTGITNNVALSGLGAELKLIGNATAGVTQSMGNISIASYSTVTTQSAGATTELDLPGFDASTARSNRGTVLLRGMDNSTSFIKFVTPPTLVGGGGTGTLTSILPSAVGDTSPTGLGSDFVTVTGPGNAVRVLTSGEYTTLASGSTAINNTIADPFNNTWQQHSDRRYRGELDQVEWRLDHFNRLGKKTLGLLRRNPRCRHFLQHDCWWQSRV